MKINRRKKFEEKDPRSTFDIRMVLLSGIFLCGICAGCLTATYITGDSFNVLNEYITNCVLISTEDITAKELFFKALITIYKYPVVVFILGYTAFGIILIPSFFALRGFFISFSVTSVVRALGYKGILAAISIYGMQAALSLPCLIILASKAMRVSQGMFSFTRYQKERRLVSHATDGYITCFLLCMVCLMICATLEVFVVPKLLEWSYSLIF